MGLMISSGVYHATHIISQDNKTLLELIWVKYGFDESGLLKKRSEGLFGCITVSGRVIGGFDAWNYWRESNTELPPTYPDLESAMQFFKTTSPTEIELIGPKPLVEYDWFDSQRQE